MQQQAMPGHCFRGMRTEQVPGTALMNEFPVMTGRIRCPDSQSEYYQENDYQWQAHSPWQPRMNQQPGGGCIEQHQQVQIMGGFI